MLRNWYPLYGLVGVRNYAKGFEKRHFIRKLNSQKLFAQKWIATMNEMRGDGYDAVHYFKNCLYIREYT